ncbi:MAG: transposase, partial [Armatimonadetes bacterium]|nr:transposase [Armatimonadota bacterium]
DVGVPQSGRKKGERGLTKQGDAELRRLLFNCASASLRAKDSPFKAQYERERAKGLSSTAALCAVALCAAARKMAKVCWSIVQHGTEYDPARVYQQPKPKKDPQKEPSPLDNEP